MAEFGWAYVVGTQTKGGTGAVQVAQPDGTLSGSTQLKYSESSPGLLQLTGSLIVSGSITANQYNVNVVNETVTNLSSSGNTKFGNSIDDTHIFTGSLSLSGGSNPLSLYGLQSGSGIQGDSYLVLGANSNLFLTSSPGGEIKEYTNAANNRIITSIDSSGINAESNLLFDGSTLTVTGDLTSSVGISSSVAQFTELTGSRIRGTSIDSTTGNIVTVNSTTVTATELGGRLTTAAQPNVTSLGTLTALNITGDVSASSLFISSSNERIGVGTNSPEKKLEIYDKNEQLRLTYSKYIPFSETNVHTDLKTNSSGYLILSPSGQRVGVGTASPTRMLDVDGNVRIGGNLEITGTLSARVTDFVVSADNITFGNSKTDQLTFNAATASIPNSLNVGGNLLSLDTPSAKVGIGVQYPDNKLEVLHTSDQLKLSYNQTHGVVFDVDSIGQLDVRPTGQALTASGDFYVTGSTILGGDDSKSVNVKGALTASVALSSSLGLLTTLTASSAKITSFTDGTATISGGNIGNVNTLTATNVAGRLTTAAQPNVTSLGSLTALNVAGNVSASSLYANHATQRVGIGRTDPVRKLEVLSPDPQLRLSYSDYELFGTADVYSELYTNSGGHLILSSSGNRVGIGTASPTRMLDVHGHMRVSGNLEITGALHANVSEFIVTADNITFGQDGEDTLIFNAASGTVMNGLNWDNDTFVMDSNQNRIGIGLPFPAARLHVSSSNQALLRLNDAEFTVTHTGDLTIKPSGTYLTASSDVRISGSSYLGTLSSQHTVVSGELTASVAVSSSLGRFTELTASTITNGTVKIIGANITSVGTLTATTVGGALSTPSQTAITALGTLNNLTVGGDVTVDTDTLKIDSSNNRVGIGRADPQRKLEVFSTSRQMRLTYSKFVFGETADVFSDLSTDSNGLLVLSGSGGKTKIDNSLQVTGLAIGTGVTTKYLALDSGNNIILTSSVAPGIETRNRRVITANSTLSEDDYYVGLNASGDITLTLLGAETLVNGQTFTIKDEGGTASSHTLTISASGSQKIDGQGTVVLSNPFAAVNLYTNGVDKYFIF